MGASAPPAPTSLAPLSITTINLATTETLEFLADFYHSTNMSQLRSHNYSKKHENTFFSIQTSTIYHSSDQVHEFLRCNTVAIKLKYNATKYVTVSSKWFPLSKTISKSC